MMPTPSHSDADSPYASPSDQASVIDERVPFGQLLAYGMGGLIPIALFNIAGQLMGLLGNISLGLSAFWLGTIMVIPRLWDAVSDPVMGHITDNARTRWGRRRPFILIGGMAVAISFVGMWWVPRGAGIEALFPSEAAYNWFQLGFILTGLLIFFTACTVFEIPHGALGMEMSTDYHERTRLFSAKSFLGNLFAMGTPWLIWLAGLDFFKGTGGDLTDGMRYVSMFIAAAMIPMTWWWFSALREPGFAVAQRQEKSSFWQGMRIALSNQTFLMLVLTIFVLAMGFNFVALFNYYITIFYLFGGDAVAAGPLLGVNGTAWAVTGLVAVFPLNWLSRQYGKSTTLMIAIGLMCAAQLAKIVCYNPELPYLILIPTILLSAGMLMFFTLGSSMVGDVCDEDELATGTRSEGNYYAVYWWFIKMGTALASFVTGALLVFTHFDEKQNVAADELVGQIAVIKADAESWWENKDGAATSGTTAERATALRANIDEAFAACDSIATIITERRGESPDAAQHTQQLSDALSGLRNDLESWRRDAQTLVQRPDRLQEQVAAAEEYTAQLKRQTPLTLLRLRVIEIGLPLLMSLVSVALLRGYPLDERRCYEIKEALVERREQAGLGPQGLR